MKTAFPIAAAFLVFTFAQTALGQSDWRTEFIPEDIRAAVYKEEWSRDAPYPANYQADLLGPMELKPGEAVACTYPWKLPAVAETDAQKWIPPDQAMVTTFLFVGGDIKKLARVSAPGLNDTLVFTKPVNPNAADVPLISLAKLRTVVGIPKAVLLNRIKAPTNIERTADGKEQWIYSNVISQSRNEYLTGRSTTTGSFGGTGFTTTTTTTIPITTKRTIVIWDFKLIVSAEGKVESFSGSTPGAGPWE
jgi:hypothetical protein